MNEILKKAIVYIKDSNGRIQGAGFLVGRDYVLTCAHVVEQALKPAKVSTPTVVSLSFPFISPSLTISANLIQWVPEHDVAGVQLNNMPSNIGTTHLIHSDYLWGHTFRAFGFPTGHEAGVWASGVLRDVQTDGWLQLESTKSSGYRIQSGFSGTPIWDEQLDGVVGMVVAADVDLNVKAAFAIPSSILVKSWPSLLKYTVNSNDVEYIQYQLTLFEQAQKDSSEPHRFQSKIEMLKLTIREWENRIESQYNRIATGLEEEKRRIASERTQTRKHLQIVGRPLQDVTGFFKNRKYESETLHRLLAEPSTRLISVIGRGGIGKTAVVSKVLEEIGSSVWEKEGKDIPVNGIVYLSTRTTGISLERLFLDCAKLLNNQKAHELRQTWLDTKKSLDEKINTLLNYLSDGVYIILLDNLEDLLENTGKLTDQELQLFFDISLSRGDGATLLVTSRIPLRVRGKAMRFDQRVSLLDGLPLNDAVALLEELDPNGVFGLRDASNSELIRIAELTHGVPRALEVVVGILANDPFLSLDDVSSSFYNYDDAVNDLIEDNYQRLDEDARSVLAALSVFRRPVKQLAIDFLLEPFSLGINVPAILKQLVQTHIVSIDRNSKTVALHPIDRDYTYSQLPTSGDYSYMAFEKRAAEYYSKLRTPLEEWQDIADLEPIIYEFEHLVHAQKYDDATILLNQIDAGYLSMWGYYDRVVKMRQSLINNIKDKGLEAANIGYLGLAHYSKGQFHIAIKYFHKALPLTQKYGSRSEEIIWSSNLGKAYRNLAKPSEALRYYQNALTVAQEIDDNRQIGIQLGNIGNAYRAMCRYDDTIEYYNKALGIANSLNDAQSQGIHLSNLGIAFYDVGEHLSSKNYFDESLLYIRDVKDRRREVITLANLSHTLTDLGEFAQAVETAELGLSIATEINSPINETYCYWALGRSFLIQGKYEAALVYLNIGLELADQLQATSSLSERNIFQQTELMLNFWS